MSRTCFLSPPLPRVITPTGKPFLTSLFLPHKTRACVETHVSSGVLCSSQKCEAAPEEQTLRKTLARRRSIRRTGQMASSLLASTGIALSSEAREWSTAILSNCPAAYEQTAAVLVCVALAFFRVELGRDGNLHFSRRGPWFPHYAQNLDNLIEIRESPGKGRGAFATQRIPKDTCLGPYRGELLDTAAFLTRYPIGERYGDYVMKLDSQYVCDASASLGDGQYSFNPALMNHTRLSKRLNVVRVWHKRKRTVLFYTSREVDIGEELCFDYGKGYWQGREHLEMP